MTDDQRLRRSFELGIPDTLDDPPLPLLVLSEPGADWFVTGLQRMVGNVLEVENAARADLWPVFQRAILKTWAPERAPIEAYREAREQLVWRMAGVGNMARAVAKLLPRHARPRALWIMANELTAHLPDEKRPPLLARVHPWLPA